jgi:hypothetical protein
MEVISVAFPFCPITNEMLKKLSQTTQDSGQTIISPELSTVFTSQDFKSGLELNQKRSETDQTNHRNNIHF